MHAARARRRRPLGLRAAETLASAGLGRTRQRHARDAKRPRPGVLGSPRVNDAAHAFAIARRRACRGAVVAGRRPALSADAPASVSIAVTWDGLLHESTAAVLVTSIESRPVWENGRIYTYTRVRVDRLVAGDLLGGGDTWIRTMGGVVGKVGQIVEGEAAFAPGESSLLFVHPGPVGAFVVTARGQGQFPLVAPGAKLPAAHRQELRGRHAGRSARRQRGDGRPAPRGRDASRSSCRRSRRGGRLRLGRGAWTLSGSRAGPAREGRPSFWSPSSRSPSRRRAARARSAGRPRADFPRTSRRPPINAIPTTTRHGARR